ncbi:uncharacterized protein LOC112089988 [Eutrema salsugineum]|uniref:uncharacterized protein LOC112089988 n=1 Tax=Eutrema salsugineum TaxID=72664 RepID=UPI000CED2021|nr:uncharacterized protein LOC112089988 [Eutrema salsugineum]
MIHKKRFLTAVRDFPAGCGVFPGQISNALMQCKFKVLKIIKRRELVKDYSNDVVKDEPVLESSNEGVRDHLEKENLECSTTVRKTSSEKKRRLCLHKSTMEGESDVVNTLKRVIVSGLAANMWKQRNHVSRQMKD